MTSRASNAGPEAGLSLREVPELTAPHQRPRRDVLGLVERLCRDLDADRIAWCHWKSNVAIDRSARGDNDLDLLVARADVPRFAAVLDRLAFKEARLPPSRELPGIRDFYGYDAEGDRLVHVHAHTQLVLGHDTTKNVRLPIEEPYLRSSSARGLFRLPSPEFEHCVLVVRLMLKHATWDAILGLDAGLSPGERRELEDLEARIDQEEVHRLVTRHLPYVGAELMDRCAESLRPGASIWSRYRAGRELLRSLRAHMRRPPARDSGLRVWRRLRWGVRRYVLKRRTGRRLATGGAIIAVVGSDGAGKSVAVEHLCRWLGRVFVVQKVHLGKPPRSWSSFAAKAALKIARMLAARRSMSATGTGAPTPAARFVAYASVAWHVLTARDRLRAYWRARRFAASGGIVITDRYPLLQVKSMDGPRAARTLPAQARGRLADWMVGKEQASYRHIVAPDLLIVLRVDPEIAVRRRADQDAAWVRGRAEEVWTLDWRSTGADVIDSGKPWPEMMAEIKTLVWSRL